MSKAAELAALIGSGQAQGDKNLIINGNFDVWQRGTSFSDANDVYTADRFNVVSGGGTTGDTVSQQSFTAGQTDVPNEPTYFLRYAMGGTSSNKVMHHRIEDVRTGAGKTCTLTFYAKASTGHTSTVEVAQVFGSGGSSQVTQSAQNYTMTTSWQKFTFTIALPSISGKTIGTSSYVYIAFIRSLSSSNVSIDIAQMQFEVGDVATPFEHESFAETLQKCQRYFQKRVFTDADAIWVGANYNGTSAYGVIEHIVTMRTEPSGAYSGTLADYKYYTANGNKTPIAMAINSRNSENSSETHIAWSGALNANGAGWLRAAGTGAFVQLEAEL